MNTKATRFLVASTLRMAAAELDPHTVNAGLVPTVNSFLHILLSHLTQYDMKLSAKDGNIHRLAHFLGAANKVALDMEGKLESQQKEDLEALKASMSKRFTDGFPPLKRTLRAIDLFLEKGVAPKYPVPKQAKTEAR